VQLRRDEKMKVPVDRIHLDALKEYGRQIEERRHSSRWSYLDIAQKMSVSVAAVGQIERGEPGPSPTDLERVGEFLGFPIDTFDKILRRLRIQDAGARGGNVVELSQHRK
jgi:transcriptional regulator with XRE-family HTH domain